MRYIFATLSFCVCFFAVLPAHAESLTIQTLAGAPTGEFDGPGVQALFNAPNAVAIDAAGNILVADSANNTIRKVTPAGKVSTLAGQAPISGFADGSSGSFDGVRSGWSPSPGGGGPEARW